MGVKTWAEACLVPQIQVLLLHAGASTASCALFVVLKECLGPVTGIQRLVGQLKEGIPEQTNVWVFHPVG